MSHSSDDDEFLKAIAALSPDHLYDGKYGPSKSANKGSKHSKHHKKTNEKVLGPSFQPSTPGTTTAQPSSPYTPSSNDFAHLLRHELDAIQPLKKSKKRAPTPSRVAPSALPAHPPPFGRQLITDPLPTDDNGLRNIQLTASHRALIKRYQRADIDFDHVVNGRKLSLHKALSEIIDEIHYAWKTDVPFVRITTGRGAQSRQKIPKIKRAVIEWLESDDAQPMVLGYAPVEIGHGGDYGEILVEIRPYDGS